MKEHPDLSLHILNPTKLVYFKADILVFSHRIINHISLKSNENTLMFKMASICSTVFLQDKKSILILLSGYIIILLNSLSIVNT